MLALCRRQAVRAGKMPPNSRNIMRRKLLNFLVMEGGGIHAAAKKYKFFQKTVDNCFDVW
jgi:hypothetical protein